MVLVIPYQPDLRATVIEQPETLSYRRDFESFVASCERKNYSIEIGDAFTVDVTDYDAVDCNSLFAEIEKAVTAESM